MIGLNYYYDIDLNFDMDTVWEFYEWEKEDLLTHVKKIPLFRVSHETLCDFLMYHIRLEEDFVKSLAQKTVLTQMNEEVYATFLMSDTKNSLAVMVNDAGDVIAMSKTLVEDDNNINEFMYTLKETVLSYTLLEKREKRRENRQESRIKQLILVELQTLLEEQNVEKLKYFYYECFQKEESNLVQMYEEMTSALNGPIDDNILNISYLIRLSYHQV